METIPFIIGMIIIVTVLIVNFFKDNCDHEREHLKPIGIGYRFTPISDLRVTGQKYVSRCKKCGKVKSYKVNI